MIDLTKPFHLRPEQEKIFHDVLENFDRTHGNFRLWARDATLFTGNDEATMMDWLDEPERLLGAFAPLIAITKDIEARKFSSIVLLGMGGSSATAKALQGILAPTANYFHVLDSIHPSAIARIEENIDVSRTLFIVASKSGSTLEPNVLYRYFLERLTTSGVDDPFSHFMAITDPVTSLEQESVEHGFLRGPFGRPGIGGRYSALSVFGILPAMLMGLDGERLLTRAVATAKMCGPTTMALQNPAAILAAFCLSSMKVGRDQLVIHLSDSLKDFGLWLEQLLAESLGKNGTGIVPIVDYGHNVVHNDSTAYLVISLDGESLEKEFQRPFAHLVLNREDISGLMFRFECATALIGAGLQINPFDQPDVEKSKRRALSLITQPQREQEKASKEDVRNFFKEFSPQDYCGILSFLDESNESEARLLSLARAITKKFSINTTIQIGPRFLHSTGQLWKGGKNNGHFLVLTGPYAVDRMSSYAQPFSHLHKSQALGDIDALKESGRRVLHVAVNNLRDLDDIVNNF